MNEMLVINVTMKYLYYQALQYKCSVAQERILQHSGEHVFNPVPWVVRTFGFSSQLEELGDQRIRHDNLLTPIELMKFILLSLIEFMKFCFQKIINTLLQIVESWNIIQTQTIFLN